MKFRIGQDDIMFFLLISSLINLFGRISVFIALLSSGIFLLFNLRKNKSIRIVFSNYYLLWIAFFYFYSLMTLFWTKSTFSVLFGIRGLAECFIIGIAIFFSISTLERINKIIKIYCLSCFFLLCKILLFTETSNILVRDFGVVLNANTIGIQFAIAIVLMIWLQKEKQIGLTLASVSMVIFGAGVILTGSKKALLSIAVGLVASYLFTSENFVRKIRNASLLLIVGLGIFYLIKDNEFIYSIIGRRFQGMFNGFFLGKMYADASTYARISVSEVALMYWRERPFLGYGLNSFEAITQFGFYTHNNYIQLLFDVGLIGLFIYYSLFVWIIWKGIRKTIIYSVSEIILPLVLIIVVCDVGYVSYGDTFFQGMLAFISAIIVLLNNNHSTVESNLERS